MRFGHFSFGSLRIDSRPFEHDVVIDRGETRDRRKSRPRNSAMTLDTRHYPLGRTYPGNAANSSSVPVHTADCG
jgi:hypothetical protein